MHASNWLLLSDVLQQQKQAILSILQTMLMES